MKNNPIALFILGIVIVIALTGISLISSNYTGMQAYGGYVQVKGTVFNLEKCDFSHFPTGKVAYGVSALVGDSLVGSGAVQMDGTYQIMFQNLENYLSLGKSINFFVDNIPCGTVDLNYFLLKAIGRQVVYDLHCEQVVKCPSASPMTVSIQQDKVVMPETAIPIKQTPVYPTIVYKDEGKFIQQYVYTPPQNPSNEIWSEDYPIANTDNPIEPYGSLGPKYVIEIGWSTSDPNDRISFGEKHKFITNKPVLFINFGYVTQKLEQGSMKVDIFDDATGENVYSKNLDYLNAGNVWQSGGSHMISDYLFFDRQGKFTLKAYFKDVPGGMLHIMTPEECVKHFSSKDFSNPDDPQRGLCDKYIGK